MQAMRGLKLLAAIACGLLGGLSSAARAADASLEYPIKATFLEKFGEFVSWPPGALVGTAAFTICVLGEDPFGPTLDRAVSGHTLDGHPMSVRRINGVNDTTGCQVLYVGRMRAAADVLNALAGRPILTVTDDATWTGTPKGIIHFTVRDNRVRFAIDDAAAAGDGLAISSKLLSIAVSVNPRPRSAS
jgi:hypothetical protein